MRYELIRGRVQTWALEAHVVDHCNLRCVQCCSLSPKLPARLTSAPQLQRDVAAAAEVLAPQTFKLAGGEPFLHPQLAELLQVARASNIARQYSVTTNGFLAATAPDEIFEQLDRLTLSLYSSAPLPVRTLDRLRRRCREHDIVLSEKAFTTFQRINPPQLQSAHDAAAAFKDCWMKTRCHLIQDGRFFTCTRPPHLDALHGDTTLSVADGVPLKGEDVLAKLLAHLERETPLASCRHCLGNSGEWVQHEQERLTGPAA